MLYQLYYIYYFIFLNPYIISFKIWNNITIPILYLLDESYTLYNTINILIYSTIITSISPYSIYLLYLYYNKLDIYIKYVKLIYYISFGYFYPKIYNNYIEKHINIYTSIHVYYLYILIYCNVYNKLDKLFLFAPYSIPFFIKNGMIICKVNQNKIILNILYSIFGLLYNSILIVLYIHIHEYFLSLLSMIHLIGYMYYIKLNN